MEFLECVNLRLLWSSNGKRLGTYIADGSLFVDLGLETFEDGAIDHFVFDSCFWLGEFGVFRFLGVGGIDGDGSALRQVKIK